MMDDGGNRWVVVLEGRKQSVQLELNQLEQQRIEYLRQADAIRIREIQLSGQIELLDVLIKEERSIHDRQGTPPGP